MEYKFKAWVKPVIENGEVIYTGCMVDVWEIDFKRRKIIYYEPFDLLPMVGKKEELSFDEIELLPYTGVKDKNGNEIYLGDLVMVADYASWEGLYKVIWDEENSMYMIEDAYGDREKLCEFEEYLKKGNIYENPELLERCI
jgi:uncharacterized phage protein (TIGR01671 family)